MSFLILARDLFVALFGYLSRIPLVSGVAAIHLLALIHTQDKLFSPFLLYLILEYEKHDYRLSQQSEEGLRAEISSDVNKEAGNSRGTIFVTKVAFSI